MNVFPLSFSTFFRINMLDLVHSLIRPLFVLP